MTPWRKWAESASPNKGNQAKGCISSKFGKVVEHDPSVWMYEHWFYPDYSFRNSGRNRYVSYSVWLSEQYNPKEWEDEDNAHVLEEILEELKKQKS